MNAKSFLLFCGVALVSQHASGSTAFYSTRAAFLGAVSSSTTLDFQDLTPGSYNTPSGVTDGGVFFVGVTSGGNGLDVISDCDGNSTNICVDGPAATDATFGYLRVTLPAGIDAIGTDIVGFQGWAAPYEIRLSTGDVLTGNLTDVFFSFDFVGFVSDTPITYADFYVGLSPTHGNAAQNVVIDDFTFGSAVPEPSSGFLTAFTLLAAGLLLSRLRQNSLRGRFTI